MGPQGPHSYNYTPSLGKDPRVMATQLPFLPVSQQTLTEECPPPRTELKHTPPYTHPLIDSSDLTLSYLTTNERPGCAHSQRISNLHGNPFTLYHNTVLISLESTSFS
ncbi:unnamed protein product [Pleuronectes platessa]|uniref:Uncharacterized protein n=1 Tax=Pleuronectes platessa TaxID=8262 RepID=A0A9N7YT40_PLEPL|nr:unnamed protein product [Pleuronectes platessa]